jgi:hypothetical protein
MIKEKTNTEKIGKTKITEITRPSPASRLENNAMG